MQYLEYSQDPTHGGGAKWGFGDCLWSPTRKDNGTKWGYWEIMRSVRANDIIFHIRGRSKKAAFVGTSIADSDCYETDERPPDPGRWGFAHHFLRVPLRDFTTFESPVNVYQAFQEKFAELVAYHSAHSPSSGPNGRLLFYVPQSGTLQGQNGAYLSQFDADLQQIFFNDISVAENTALQHSTQVVPTGLQLAQILARVGQRVFSENVRTNYDARCCFPECAIIEFNLLVGSHIARWADAPSLRGETSNGLSLCLLHDRLFERGVYTVDRELKIVVNVDRANASPWAMANVLPFHGQEIRRGRIAPALAALKEHWKRTGFQQLE